MYVRQHSSPISSFRPENRQRNWRTLLINCRSLKGKVANFLASLNYYQPVPHQRLLHKLDHYGIRGTTLNLIKKILTNRTQKVVVDSSSSESARLRSFAPGYCSRTPTLFNINDLPSTFSSQIHLFADDCLLYRSIKCRAAQEQLQRDLSALQDLAVRLGMCFNPSKCSVLRVSRPKFKNLEFEYTLNPFTTKARFHVLNAIAFST